MISVWNMLHELLTAYINHAHRPMNEQEGKRMQMPKWVDQYNKSCNNWFSFVNSNVIVCMSAFGRMISNYMFMAAIEMTNQTVQTIYKNAIIFHSFTLQLMLFYDYFFLFSRVKRISLWFYMIFQHIETNWSKKKWNEFILWKMTSFFVSNRNSLNDNNIFYRK